MISGPDSLTKLQPDLIRIRVRMRRTILRVLQHSKNEKRKKIPTGKKMATVTFHDEPSRGPSETGHHAHDDEDDDDEATADCHDGGGCG